MAGKGGGAWKVAYADFVTAMMAFFLVMWICGQDQKIKRAVSYYFSHPLDTSKISFSNRMTRNGAMADNPETGSLPMAESVAMGRGRNPYLNKGENSVCTKLVSDWLHADKKAKEYWHEQARRQRDLARWGQQGRDDADAADADARRRLAQQLKDEIKLNVPAPVAGLYRNLMNEVLAEVNWREIAEDLLAQ